jgi:HTH-type transcriptional regulator / antitoxin HigA
MKRRSKQAIRRGADDNYLKLVQTFPLRPIRSDDELDRAIAMIDSLITREDIDLGGQDYLDVLSDLVHRYEAEHDPIAPVPDADMVSFLLESNDMSQSELAKRSEIAESTISEILAGKRKLSRRHIAALSRIFHVSPALFFHEVTEITPERAAEVLQRRSGIELSHNLLVSLASALAMDPDRGCWRALQEIVAGERPGMSTKLIAERLNVWGGGGDCWRPSSFHLTGAEIRALADAFSSEAECWKLFREMVEETIPEIRLMQRQIAEEN